MKKAVITGITSGIGKAIAEKLSSNGWEVIGISRKDVDLSDLEAVEKYAVTFTRKHHKIDAFIHVAGIWHDQEAAHANKDLEDFKAEQIARTMAVGVTSCMILLANFLPLMPKNGMIIGISGTFNEGANGWLPYYTSKRALEDFLVGLAQDYPSGPRVFGVSPADTGTPAYKKFYSEYFSEAQSPEAIGSLCLDLINGEMEYKSGDIIEIRNGKRSEGFHK